jgi:hypothetical protein
MVDLNIARFRVLIKNSLMLELQKFVLQRVYDDANLFKRELIKSIKWLSSSDLAKLRKWVMLEFGNIHSDIIKEVLC